MTPRTTCCWLLSKPARMRPLLISPISSAPNRVPTTDPLPPNRLVPPRITAAMADSSSPAPHWNRPDWSRPAYSMPATLATVADSSSTWNLIRLVLTPVN